MNNANVIYTDGSRDSTGCSSGWLVTKHNHGLTSVLAQGCCNIGPHADIIDAEVHAIHEAIKWIRTYEKRRDPLYICVDNQTALRALAGGQCSVRQDLRLCLEGIMALRQEGCSVKGQWTPSHMGIQGNEQADTLASQGHKEAPCNSTKCTITWLRMRARTNLMEKWALGCPNPPTNL